MTGSLASAAPVRGSAQEIRSKTERFLIGFNVTGSSLEVEDADPESGGGGGLTLGWGVSRRVALFLRGDVSTMEINNPEVEGDYSLILIDLGARIGFGGPEKRFVPYLMGALTAMTAAATIPAGPVLETEASLTGGGISLGGGFQYYFTPSVALDIQAIGSAGRFTRFELGTLSQEIDDLEVSAGRLNIGLTFHPGG
jgi:hypothetical protein